MTVACSSAFERRLSGLAERLSNARLFQSAGRVVQVAGVIFEAEGPLAGLGELCAVEIPHHPAVLAEVVGFKNGRVLLMPLTECHGLRAGSSVVALGHPLQVSVSDQLKGRVIDSLGRPLDGLPLPPGRAQSLHQSPPHPLLRRRIAELFASRIKAIDAFTPCGRGQRLGIFAGSGVGKSTLLGMIASRAEADVNVIALIGERGREVREFLENDLDAEGRAKSVVIVATSNEPALARIKGAFLALAVAEFFRDQGRNVLLLFDSITRFALAQRELGLAVGEPPTTRGYTPSVFALLPQLLERAGQSDQGAITAFFSVLVESDDLNDPVADAVRSILDGHIVLSRERAAQNLYPAIDVLESVSRLSRDLLTPEQLKIAGRARALLALYKQNQDLIQIGAYRQGANPEIDLAIRLHDPLNKFIAQSPQEGFLPTETWSRLASLLAPISNSPANPTQPSRS